MSMGKVAGECIEDMTEPTGWPDPDEDPMYGCATTQTAATNLAWVSEHWQTQNSKISSGPVLAGLAVAAELRRARRLQSLMDQLPDKMATESFTAADDTETVAVTLNRPHWLKDVYVQDGPLRLGAATVEDRVNEALQEASASIDTDRERTDAVVAEITAELRDERW